MKEYCNRKITNEQKLSLFLESKEKMNLKKQFYNFIRHEHVEL